MFYLSKQLFQLKLKRLILYCGKRCFWD